jgi:hypothetical protein
MEGRIEERKERVFRGIGSEGEDDGAESSA